MSALSQQKLEQLVVQTDAVDVRILDCVNRAKLPTATEIAELLGCSGHGAIGTRLSRLVALGLLKIATDLDVKPRRYSLAVDGSNLRKLVHQPWLMRAQRSRDHVRALPKRAA